HDALPICSQGLVFSQRSNSQPTIRPDTTDAKRAKAAAYAMPDFRLVSSLSSGTTEASPATARQVVFRCLEQQSASRMPHGIVNETYVRAPTGLAAIDGVQFRLALLCRPQYSEVVGVIFQRRKLLAQLAGA